MELLRGSGLGKRLDAEGMEHDGIYLQFEGERHHINIRELTGGRWVTVYAQTEIVKDLIAARLAADVLDVPTVLVARTDAHSASLLTSDIDPDDAEFLTGERTAEGFFRVREGVEAAIARSLSPTRSKAMPRSR